MKRDMLSVSIIIPTKNRYDALADALNSIACQTVPPRQIIVVDQTPRPFSKTPFPTRSLHPHVQLDYFHDPRISGSATARNLAIDKADGDVLLFLDDDVTLYPSFIQQLLSCYDEHPEATGISGIPDNYSSPQRFFYYWSKLFTRGPFWNDRFPIYRNLTNLAHPVRVSQMSGGMMSLKRFSLNGTRFDHNLRGVCDGEDVDLCVRLKGTYFIDPRCRLTHHSNPVGRETDHWTRRHARAYTYLYLRNWSSHKLAYAWLSFGWLLAAAIASLRRFSLNPFHSLFAGLREGRCAARMANCLT
jgi:GT2 family glycosyltransferase